VTTPLGAAPAQTHGAGTARPHPHVPGEVGIWVFVLGDMTVFAALFAGFVYYRSASLDIYLQSQATLNQSFGAINTLLLLTSSWFVVMGTDAARRDAAALARRLFAVAFLCGAGFVAVKFFEYREKALAGLTPISNEFFSFYYMLTGLHLLHVLIGMVVLAVVFRRAGSPTGFRSASDVVFLECGASYWHMVDLLWIVLFPLLYLMK
jgi:nitric oxide reductase NorE protein